MSAARPPAGATLAEVAAWHRQAIEMLEILRAEGHHCKLATETWVR